MKRFEITCIKINKFSMNQAGAQHFTRQIIKTDQDKINYNVPDGYTVISIVELLPDAIIINEKTN